MPELTEDQWAALCECLDETRRAEGKGVAEIPELIERLLARSWPDISRPEVSARYKKWKMQQRVLEDKGHAVEQSCDPEAMDAFLSPDKPIDTADGLQIALGCLLSYMGKSLTRQKAVMRRSEVLLREGETFRRYDEPGEAEMPSGERVRWIVAALVMEEAGRVTRIFPECQFKRRTKRRGVAGVEFFRITVEGSEANDKALRSTVAAMLWLYQATPEAKESLRKLAKDIDVTVANLSHHARRLAKPVIAAGGHARFPHLRNVEKLAV